jgi:hypothetical protein
MTPFSPSSGWSGTGNSSASTPVPAIYVDDSVLNSSKAAASVTDKINNEELRRWLEGLGDDDLGRYKM